MGLLRAGAAYATQNRTDDGRHGAFEGSFGLGVVRKLTPTLGLELAWDITTADGNNTSSSLIQVLSAGLRLSF
jgi:hypothetical protein